MTTCTGAPCAPGSAGSENTNIWPPATALRSARERASRFRAAAFLDALEAAYLCLSRPVPGPGRVVRLVDIWELLPLRPGTGNDYSKVEFGRDLSLLDESGVTVTRAGRTIRFSASSGDAEWLRTSKACRVRGLRSFHVAPRL